MYTNPIPDPNRHLRERGFTLIELLVVMAIVTIMMVIAAPIYEKAIIRAKESVLQSNLFSIRNTIDYYTLDKQEAPDSLQDLVTAGYLSSIPQDPLTGQSNTWEVVQEQASVEATLGTLAVHSGSDKKSLNGTDYASW